MGAIIHKKGVHFRVWAPNAEAVYVTGAFNKWSETADPLKRDENGYWAGKVAKAKANDEYKYVIINGEQKLQRIDPYARQVTSSVGNSVIYANNYDWEDDNFQIAPWHELIIYEMHIGTFNSMKRNKPGNLRDAISRFPYLQKLGVNAVEIMPITEFPGGRSWGYNPSSIFAVESEYGGPDALKDFVKAAHQHGIAVILDVVYNHMGPSDLDLWRFDGWCENEGGGIYFYNDERAETPWGATRPDYGRPEVRQYLRDNALMWLEEYHIDGLRWDSTLYMRNVIGQNNAKASDIPEAWALMQWINEEIKAHFPGRISIAEDLQQNPWLTKPTSEGGAAFDAQWDSAFVHPVRTALISDDDAFRDLDAVAGAIATIYNGDAFDRVIYTESHDEVANGRARLPEDINPGNAGSWFAQKRSVLGAVLVFTAPGIPMIFQGQEFLEDEWFRDDAPLDWAKQKEFTGILRIYRDLIHLRRNHDGNTQGLCGHFVQVHHIDQERKVIAFVRWNDKGNEHGTIVIVNMADATHQDYAVGLPAKGVWRTRFNSDGAVYNLDWGNEGVAAVEAQPAEDGALPFYGVIEIGPYSALILSRDPA
ncbi:MAG: alpha amylase C-terminal domain-containing protein [Caldilineaceae bacterium]|nr:alpha amylase C-terminal domain-containing protein [Caldilineaceae bacterium]